MTDIGMFALGFALSTVIHLPIDWMFIKLLNKVEGYE